jgi:hypothetical protein
VIIFVVGSARSGTTLMANLLGRHPSIFAFKELHFLEELWVPHDLGHVLDSEEALALTAQLMKNQELGRHAPVGPKRFYDQAAGFLETQPTPLDAIGLYQGFLRHHTEQQHRQVPLTQTPRDLYYVGEILDLFAEARVIWMVRDPRAVLCSQKLRWRRPLWRDDFPSRFHALRAWLNYHPITYSLLWRTAYRAAGRFANHPSVRRVFFESLIANPMAELGSLLDWLGMEYADGLLEVDRAGSSHHPDRPSDSGIDPEVLTRWRHSCLTATEISICQHLTGDEMRDSGYALEPASINPVRLLYFVASWLPRASAAFLINLSRTRSPLLTLRRRLMATTRPGV